MKCLMENMAQPNFGEECKEELQKREDVMKSDYRFDFGVASNCQVWNGVTLGVNRPVEKPWAVVLSYA